MSTELIIQPSMDKTPSLMSKEHSQKLLSAIGGNKSVEVARIVKSQFLSPRGIEFPKVIESGYYLAQMTKECGEEVVILHILALFTDLLSYLNVKTNLSANQLEYFVYEFYENYSKGLEDDPSYTIEDVALFCVQAKSGKFGKVYNTIDGTILNDWIAQFDRERYERYSEHLRTKERLEAESDRKIETPPTPETLQKFKEKMKVMLDSWGKGTTEEEREQKAKERIKEKRERMNWTLAESEEAEVQKVLHKVQLPDKEQRLEEFWKIKLQSEKKRTTKQSN